MNTFLNLASLTSKDERVSFLEMVEFYVNFINNLSSISCARRLLLVKNKDFVWSEECDKQFVELKKNLENASYKRLFGGLRQL